ncbi:MAG: permease-like cell division protein FtsX [Lachnospiraceae bacterium]|nr:permease-like cell division protein FtsX [Lachnospiraceae bacterium]
MRISTIGYSAGQGIKNIGRNRMFSIASIATMTACIFLFGLFFSIVMNFNYILKNVETNVGITVFFDENLDQASMDSIGEQIINREEVTDCKYVSADEAWESFSEKYFKGNESAAEGFKNNQDNPLANSAHYEVYVDEIENQDGLVSFIEGIPGVRMVNRSQQASQTLSTVNRLIATISIIVILILLAVSVFLINNTVTVGISVRKEEIGIMKLIGATNTFVRLPFILEGILIGLIGAIIPLAILYILYNQAVKYILLKFSVLGGIMNGLLPANRVFIVLIPVGLILGMGIGFLGCIFTIRKHLRV